MSAPQPAVAKHALGFTLTELLVVVAIAAIIAVIAFPSYTAFVTKATRSQARALLVQVADRQEQFFLDNKRYANDLTQLGFATNPLYVDRDRFSVEATATDRVYRISFQAAGNTNYTVEAVPQLHQAGADADCGTLTLTDTGVRGTSGTSTDCW